MPETTWDLEDLKRHMERLIDEEDHIRYYGLCPKEISGIQLDGESGGTRPGLPSVVMESGRCRRPG